MPWGTSAWNYAKRAGSAIAGGYGKGSQYLGATGMAAATGAGLGGVYGATAGRDYGQSRLGGFMTGAMGGAALSAAGQRYGGAALRASRRRGANAGAAMDYLWQGPMTRAQNAQSRLGTAGRGAFRQLKRDAMATKKFIGEHLGANGAMNRIKGLGW